MEKVDYIIIGGGPGGYDVASRLASEGKSVVLFEKDRLGGTCLNRGCIPTKCLCAGAETIETIMNAGRFGIGVENVTASYEANRRRTDDVVSQLRAGIESLLARCTVVADEAVINADGTVSGGGATYSADKVIVATGSRPATLPVPGIGLCDDSDAFLRRETLPESMVIIGGGVIGLEFAYIANAYGTRVTVIEYCKEILPTFDAEIAKRLRTTLAAKGIAFLTGAQVTAVERNGTRYDVKYTDRKGEGVATADNVVTAVGRKAVVPRGAEEAGITLDRRGFIETDADFMTRRPGFYAAGDCNGRMMLAHVATAQSMRIAGTDINLDVVPAAVFTQPELAMVGRTAEQCKAENINYASRKALYRANGKALASGHTDGLVKVLYDPETKLILGCHIVGAHASDLIQEAVLAMSSGLTVDQVGRQTIHGHPTLSEILAAAL